MAEGMATSRSVVESSLLTKGETEREYGPVRCAGIGVEAETDRDKLLIGKVGIRRAGMVDQQ